MGERRAQAPDEVLAGLLAAHPALAACEGDIRAAHRILASCFGSGGKLLICGNGGSAADAEHIVGELMKGFRIERPVDPAFGERYREANGMDAPSWLEGALPAIALASHTALTSAFANDEAAVGIFAQQVYGYGRAGDALLAISTSGASANVVEAARAARGRGMGVISLTGAAATELTRMADAAIRAPETETYRVQELHLPIYHSLCAMAEAEIFGGAS